MISADAAAAAAWLQRILVLGLALFLGIGLWAAALLLRMLLLGLAFMIGCHLWFLCLLIDSLRIIAAAAGAFAAAAATCRAVAALACIPGFLFFGLAGFDTVAVAATFAALSGGCFPLIFLRPEGISEGNLFKGLCA